MLFCISKPSSIKLRLKYYLYNNLRKHINFGIDLNIKKFHALVAVALLQRKDKNSIIIFFFYLNVSFVYVCLEIF